MNSEQLKQKVEELAQKAKLDTWNSFTQSCSVPAELTLAVMANRAEMVRAALPRSLSQKECSEMYNLVAVLMETNAALREHAEQVAQLVDHWTTSFKALTGIAWQIEMFANFKHDQVPGIDLTD